MEERQYTMDPDKCENKPCSCPKAEGQNFCSPSCEEEAHHGDDSTSDLSLKHCPCQHAGCTGVSAVSDPRERPDVSPQPDIGRDIIAVD